MSHHKRRRPKHQRSGCLMCKGQKDERVAKSARVPPNTRRRLQPAGEDISMAEARCVVDDGR